MTQTPQQHSSLLQPVVRPLLRHDAQSMPPQIVDTASQLLRQRQQYQTFISTLAHELRQPLATMFSAVEILREDPSSVALGRAVQVIDRQTRQMNRLVEDLMESARTARRTVLLRTERVDVRAVIADALSDAGGAISARAHRVVTSNPPDALWVDADPARLQQVLSNLLDNAIKFTEPGGTIELTACHAGTEVVVSIKDTGRGLRPNELRHIFGLFSQVRPGEGPGLGIGLNIARQIVTLHRGRIEARSDGPSQGTQFIVTLPSAA